MKVKTYRRSERNARLLTIRAIELARRSAHEGRRRQAKRAWLLACKMSSWAGGLSGTTMGGGAILLPGGYVAYAPVKL